MASAWRLSDAMPVRLPETWGDVETKTGALINMMCRLIFLPLYAMKEILEFPERVTYEEPVGYCARIVRRADRMTPLLSSTGALASGGERHESPGGFRFVLRRFVECSRESWLLTWQSLLYLAVLLPLLSLLGLEHVGRQWKANIEAAVAMLTGQYVTASDGRRFPISAANLFDGTFDAPYNVCEAFPERATLAKEGESCAKTPDVTPGLSLPSAEERNGFASPQEGTAGVSHCGQFVDGPITRHFMVLCSKLLYENPDMVRDIVQNRWGLQWHGDGHVPATSCKEGYAPDIVWAYFGNAQARVLVFKGAEPFHQIDRQTDIPVAMTVRPGVGGVNDGFYRGLMQPDPERLDQTLFQRLTDILESQPDGIPLYLTGHSLGGALPVTFAALIAARRPDLVKRVGGVYTFGSPRIGDAEFCQRVAKAYPERLFRYVHACDMVTKLPAGFGYTHHAMERFITSFPLPHGSRIVNEEDDATLIEACRKGEDVWAFHNSLQKAFGGLMKGELSYAMGRLLTLPMPGFANHFPSEYEHALRECLPAQTLA